MSYQSDKVQMGATSSSFKTVDNVPGAIAAGKVVHSKSDGTYTVAIADGVAIGVSLGRSLSDTNRTAVCRRGTGVPILLTSGLNPTIGTQVHIDDTLGIAKASGGGATGVNAVYATGRVGGSGQDKGIDEDGNAVGVAMIDFPGGL
jgi:hypothetical protein